MKVYHCLEALTPNRQKGKVSGNGQYREQSRPKPDAARNLCKNQAQRDVIRISYPTDDAPELAKVVFASPARASNPHSWRTG